jgi:YVTN family beta-propeller protein
VAADPAAGTAYVTNTFEGGVKGTVSVIDVATNAVTATIPVGTYPAGVAVNPPTDTAYVTNYNDDTVSVIDVATNAVTATIPVGNGPVGVAVNPATGTIYVTNQNDGTVSVISATGPGSGPIVSGYRANKCVTDSGDSAANDTPITIATCDGSPGQDWTVTSSGTLKVNGKCLDIYRDEKTSKAPVELYTCTGGANQQWHATAGTLVNPVSGKCLDDPRFNTTPGTRLELYTCNGGANQQWKIP